MLSSPPVMDLSKSVAGRLSYGMIVYTSAVYLRINALMQPFTIDSSMYDNFAACINRDYENDTVLRIWSSEESDKLRVPCVIYLSPLENSQRMFDCLI
jgi:hypothetical protein